MTPEELEHLLESVTEKYQRYLNPSLPNLLKFMGFGTVSHSKNTYIFGPLILSP